MALIEEMEASGAWLFRWRSYLPLTMFVLIVASLSYFHKPYGSEMLDELWEGFCLFVGCCGFAVRGLVAAYAPSRTSGRNTKKQVADSLTTTGIYSVVRNPLYLGNFLIGMSIALFLHVWWIPLIYALAFMLYYERIIFTEEIFLRKKFGEAYLNWAARTPAFFPRLSGWEKPATTFSLRTLIRREYRGVFVMIALLFAMEQISDAYLGEPWHIDPIWGVLIGSTTAFCLIVRILDRSTAVLKVEGR